MASSPTSEVIMSDEDYRNQATDTFQKYARAGFEDSHLLEVIQIDFEHWTKENWEAIDGNTWMTIKQHCIPRGVWIDHYGNNGTRAEILMKLVSTEYDDDLKDWDMNRIKQVEKTYGKVSRGIQYREQELLGDIPGPSVLPSQPAPGQGVPTAPVDTPFNEPVAQQARIPRPMQQPLLQQGQSLPQQQPFVSQDLRNQQDFRDQPDYRNQSGPRSQQYNQRRLYEPHQQQPAYRHQPTYGPQYAYENQYRPNDYQPAPSPVPTNRQYSKELTQLDKLYKNEDKFGGTGDNFTFKLSIFYDKCQLVGLPPDAYLEGASVMLTGQAQTHFYANRESIVSFDDFCRKIRLFFEGPEWERLNLIKWQTVSLADTIAANPTLSTTECLRKMCTEIDKIQRSVNSAYRGPIHLRDNIIRACRGHPALAAGLTNPPSETSDMVNSLCSSIINYEAVHKPSSIENYIQSETDWGDDEIFFTDRQYRRHRSMRGRHRGTSSLSRPSYRPGTFQRTKKCFVCGKVSCWSSNHTQQERDDSKKKFGDRYPEYKARPSYERNLQRWITEYEGVDDDEDIAHYFGDLSIDTNEVDSWTSQAGRFHD